MLRNTDYTPPHDDTHSSVPTSVEAQDRFLDLLTATRCEVAVDANASKPRFLQDSKRDDVVRGRTGVQRTFGSLSRLSPDRAGAMCVSVAVAAAVVDRQGHTPCGPGRWVSGAAGTAARRSHCWRRCWRRGRAGRTWGCRRTAGCPRPQRKGTSSAGARRSGRAA
jgi:hypothetical protein